MKPVVAGVVALLLAFASYAVVASWISSDNSWGGWVFAECLAGLGVLAVWTVRCIAADPAKFILAVYSVTALPVALAALVAESFTRAGGIAGASVVFVAIMAGGGEHGSTASGENGGHDR